MPLLIKAMARRESPALALTRSQLVRHCDATVLHLVLGLWELETRLCETRRKYATGSVIYRQNEVLWRRENCVVVTMWAIGCNLLSGGGDEFGLEMAVCAYLTTLVPPQDNHGNVNKPGLQVYVSRDDAVGKATLYGLGGGGAGGSNPCGGENFPTIPARPWGPLNFLYNGYRVLAEGKEARAWHWPATPI
jgi:hypothetical protein